MGNEKLEMLDLFIGMEDYESVLEIIGNTADTSGIQRDVWPTLEGFLTRLELFPKNESFNRKLLIQLNKIYTALKAGDNMDDDGLYEIQTAYQNAIKKIQQSYPQPQQQQQPSQEFDFPDLKGLFSSISELLIGGDYEVALFTISEYIPKGTKLKKEDNEKLLKILSGIGAIPELSTEACNLGLNYGFQIAPTVTNNFANANSKTKPVNNYGFVDGDSDDEVFDDDDEDDLDMDGPNDNPSVNTNGIENAIKNGDFKAAVHLMGISGHYKNQKDFSSQMMEMAVETAVNTTDSKQAMKQLRYCREILETLNHPNNKLAVIYLKNISLKFKGQIQAVFINDKALLMSPSLIWVDSNQTLLSPFGRFVVDSYRNDDVFSVRIEKIIERSEGKIEVENNNNKKTGLFVQWKEWKEKDDEDKDKKRDSSNTRVNKY